MSNPEEILVKNLVEALKQLQYFMVLGLSTSISMLMLTGARWTRKQPSGVTDSVTVERNPDVTVQGILVAVDRDFAVLLLLGLCILSGAMATYSTETVSLIYSKLSPEMQVATCTFPSVAKSKYIGFRLFAAVLPFVFAMIAAWREVRPSKEALGGCAILLGSAYLLLIFRLWAPQCLAR
jgi:hypothetical protein